MTDSLHPHCCLRDPACKDVQEMKERLSALLNSCRYCLKRHDSRVACPELREQSEVDQLKAKLEAAEKAWFEEVAKLGFIGGPSGFSEMGIRYVIRDLFSRWQNELALKEKSESSLKAAKEALERIEGQLQYMNTLSGSDYEDGYMTALEFAIVEIKKAGQPLPEDRYRKEGSLGRCPLCRNVLVETVSGQNIKCVCCYNVWVLDKPICAIKKEGTPKGSSAIGGSPTLAPTGQQTGKQPHKWNEREAVSLPWASWDTDGVLSCRIGSPGEDHDCDQMGCSSVEHVLQWRSATEDEKRFHAMMKTPQGGGAESRKGD